MVAVFNSVNQFFQFIYAVPFCNKSSLGALETQSMTAKHMATPSVAWEGSGGKGGSQQHLKKKRAGLSKIDKVDSIK